MDSLKEKIAYLNARFPFSRVRVVEFRTRRFPDFSRRPDLRASVIPDHCEFVVYKVSGKIHTCRIEEVIPEMSGHLERHDTFETMKKDIRKVEEIVRRMGLDVMYLDLDFDIAGRVFAEIEEEFVEQFFVLGDVLKVFRVKNGPGYGFVTLLDKTAFIQKPTPGKEMRDLAQAMLVNSYLRGDTVCAICGNETKQRSVAFKCMMHAYCHDCIVRVLKGPNPECPTCRAPPGQGDV
jgi:hypothetical protein